MQAILVVEPTPTFRQVIEKKLQFGGYKICSATSYAAGLQQLEAEDAIQQFAAVVIGLPLGTQSDADDILDLLEQPNYQQLPLLILAHENEPTTFDWVAQRGHSAMLLWNNCGESAACLKKLLAPSQFVEQEFFKLNKNDIRILFVDDSRTIRANYKKLLNKNGYVVETAANVSEGMDRARSGVFDIAIIDYFMPNENGDVLCRKLQQDPQTASMTSAILTATYLDEVIKDSLNAGAVECMFKNEANELFLARLAAMARSVQIRKSIQSEHLRLSSILASVGDGVYGVDTEGHITFINPAAKEILGFTDEMQLIGQFAHDVFHYALEDGKDNPKATCHLQQAYAAGNELKSWETIFWHQSGKPVPTECTVFPLHTEDKLEGSVVAFRNITERKILETELLWQANHDTLTKLPNRNFFETELENEVKRTKRNKQISALLYIDLDRFKYINDTAGHIAGDQLLMEISSQLHARLRDADVLARLGGDEFAIILRNINKDDVYKASEGFRQILEDYTFIYQERSYNVNGSIGAALIDEHIDSPGDVLANADIACHVAKSRGRNQSHLYRHESDEKVAMNLELGWSVRLQEALKNGHFLLHYQPIVDIGELLSSSNGSNLNSDGSANFNVKANHFEVLLRLKDNKGKIISPNAFLPTAERFGIMPQIDTWVLQHAIAKLADLQQYDSSASFTINLSGQTMDPDNIIHVLKDLLQQYDVNPQTLIFEITETSAIANIDAAKKLIAELRILGCRFALDDFGSGFSSFHHLKHLPVDFIKIDGQFVQGMASSATDLAIVTSINDIAHSFGKKTIAEFVENETILNLLRHHGVDFAQGFYISSPGPTLNHDGMVMSKKRANL